MKICYVSNLYGGNARGGAERIVAVEAAEAVRRGWPATVVSSSDGAGTDAAEAAGPKVVRYHPPNVFFYSDAARHSFAARFVWHLVDLFNFRSAARLRRILEAERPDVVHTHNLMGLGSMIPGMLRRLGFRHVHTVHDVQLIHPSGLIPADGALPPSGIAGRAYVALTRRLMGSPAAVIFPSKFLMDLHRRLGFFRSSNCLVLSNPAPAAAPAARPAPARPLFLFVGQLERHKGVLDLIEAWSRWPGNAGSRLEIAGDGSLAAEVRGRAAAAPNAVCLGRLGGRELTAAYDRAAFLVMPSLVIENAPTVILESFSRGTPVAASAAGGIPELVSDGRNGFLFKPGSIEGLLAALDRAVAALPDWPALSAAASAAAAERSLERHMTGLLKTYAG